MMIVTRWFVGSLMILCVMPFCDFSILLPLLSPETVVVVGISWMTISPRLRVVWLFRFLSLFVSLPLQPNRHLLSDSVVDSWWYHSLLSSYHSSNYCCPLWCCWVWLPFSSRFFLLVFFLSRFFFFSRFWFVAIILMIIIILITSFCGCFCFCGSFFFPFFPFVPGQLFMFGMNHRMMLDVGCGWGWWCGWRYAS